MNHQPPPERRGRRFALPISWKLLGATAMIGAVAAAIAIIGLKRIQTLNHHLTQTVELLATNSKLASLVKQELITVTRAERNMMLARSEDGTKRFAAVVDEVTETMERRVAELRVLLDEQDQRQLDLFSEKWASWRKNHEDVRRFTAVSSDVRARGISLGEAQAAIDRLEEALAAIVQTYQRELDSAKGAGDYDRSTMAAETLNLAAGVSRAALAMQHAEKNLILAPTEAEMRRYEETFAALQKNLENRVEQLKAALVEGNADVMAEVHAAYEEYLDANRRIRTVAGETTSFLAYHFVYDIGAPIAAECESILDRLIEKNEQQMQAYRIASQQTYVSARNTLLAISIFGIFFSVAISFYTGHRIARRLSLLSEFANSIQSTGDLSQPTPRLGGDEVGLLAESFEQMRQSLHERTVSLGEKTDKLAELSRTLESKNKEMEQFVYTVSHDLKSPLVSCKGLLGLLKDDMAEGNFEAVVDSAARLERATDQLNQIIEDLLMLSRLGRKTLSLCEIDAKTLLKELTHELADRIADARAEIEIDENIPQLVADKSDARRVFENLITNALKYGGENPKIVIGGTSDSWEVRYFVRDNGPGIDPKYHEKIFGLFQRLDTNHIGTGLGLASVVKMMTLHGGRVWVESELGSGATFWVAFPHPPRPEKA